MYWVGCVGAQGGWVWRVAVYLNLRIRRREQGGEGMKRGDGEGLLIWKKYGG